MKHFVDTATGITVTHTYATKKGVKTVQVPLHKFYLMPSGKHTPHQGEQEKARRLRQKQLK